MPDSSVRCGETYCRPLGIADACRTRICCSQDDVKSSHGCCNQGQAIYTKSTRTRVVTMCQNQGQTINTRNARTRTVAIKLNMPNPFFALVHTSEFLPREMGAGTTSFHFKRLYRPRSRSGRSRQELKENKSRGPNPARYLSFESHLKAGTIPATLF
jgi:hypothetical protein